MRRSTARAILLLAGPLSSAAFVTQAPAALISQHRQQRCWGLGDSPAATSHVRLNVATMLPPPTADSQDSSEREKNVGNQNTNRKQRSSFGQRMRDAMKGGKRQDQSIRPTTAGGKNSKRPANLKMVTTLEEYKRVVADEREKLVVVRFFATWCRACKAVRPSYYRMAEHNPDIVFVEVPVLESNVNLHQGLGVPSLPYGHIYHPEAGLVEERRISKKFFKRFEETLLWYSSGSCSLPDGESNPPFVWDDEKKAVEEGTKLPR